MALTTVNLNDLAEFVVRYCNQPEHKTPITNLKLQKLLYYIQAWHLVHLEKHTLFDAKPEAWVNGPVYRDIYFKYKSYGYWDIVLDTETSFEESLKKLALDERQKDCVLAVLEIYAPMSAETLVVKTHQELPWNEARKDLGMLEASDKTISFETMVNYYSMRLNGRKNSNSSR